MFTTSGTLTPRRPRRTWIMPAILTLIALLISGSGLGLALTANQTEQVLVWARPVVAGQRISAEDITTIALPINRPPALNTLSEGNQPVGLWVLRNNNTGELINSSQLSTTAPTIPFYPNGASLPANMVALPFATDTIGPLSDNDTININFIDSSGDPQRCTALGGTSEQIEAIANDLQGKHLPITCRLLPQMEVLYVDSANQIAYLAATPYQSQAVYTLSAIEHVQLYGERYGSTSEALPYLTLLNPANLNADMLTGPVSTTNPLLPGIRKAPTPQEPER